jgi:outer membrane protein insertion porin family
MPGAAIDPSLRLVGFVDAGQVFGDGQKIQPKDFRYSTGVGLFWQGPFGPLRISYGHPLNKKDGDRVQKIQFTFGTGF